MAHNRDWYPSMETFHKVSKVSSSFLSTNFSTYGLTCCHTHPNSLLQKCTDSQEAHRHLGRKTTYECTGKVTERNKACQTNCFFFFQYLFYVIRNSSGSEKLPDFMPYLAPWFFFSYSMTSTVHIWGAPHSSTPELDSRKVWLVLEEFGKDVVVASWSKNGALTSKVRSQPSQLRRRVWTRSAMELGQSSCILLDRSQASSRAKQPLSRHSLGGPVTRPIASFPGVEAIAPASMPSHSPLIVPTLDCLGAMAGGTWQPTNFTSEKCLAVGGKNAAGQELQSILIFL